MFEGALADPETLGRVVKKGTACTTESFLGVAQRAWAMKTGRDDLDFPARDRHPNRPKGKRWKVEDLPRLVPKLWKKFGE